jgi:hypothetical protein
VTYILAFEGFVVDDLRYRLTALGGGPEEIIEWDADEVEQVGRTPEPGDSVVVVVNADSVRIYTVDRGRWTRDDIEAARRKAIERGVWIEEVEDE